MLTLEQQFHLRHFEDSIKRMSEDQAKKMLLEVYSNSIERHNAYQDLIAKQWGIK
jgi:hypothetical protein